MNGKRMNPFFARVRRAVADGETGKDVWLGFIREAQALPDDIGWMGCYTLVQIAQTRSETATAIKAVALELYEAGALAGEPEATDLLWNFADMAGDEELLARFSHEVVPLTAEERADDEARRDKPLTAEMDAKARSALGIPGEFEITFVCTIPTARIVYRR